MATSTGVGPANSFSTPPNNYGALVGPGVTFAGIDQGIDFTGGPAPIYAIGPGTVTRVQAKGSGWPGMGALVSYTITGGPLKNQSVYVAEDFVPAAGIQVGKPIQQGEIIGQATGSGQAPGIEVGFANSKGEPVAKLLPRGSNYAAAGEDQGYQFNQSVIALTQGPYRVQEPGTATFNPLNPSHSGTGGQAEAVVTAPYNAAKDVFGAAISTGKFLGKLTDPNFWIRAIEIVGGGLLVLLGLYLIAKDLGIGVPTPTGTVGKAAAAGAAITE